jgi:hypothetical protein
MKMKQGRSIGAFLWLPCVLVLLNAGCAGPTGPMGASAPNTTPICYYCNSFDSGGVDGWVVQPGINSGYEYVYLDGGLSNSPPQSLGVSCTGSIGTDVQIYRTVSIDTNKDLWLEFDFNLNGAYNGGQEFFVNLGGTANNAVLGWDALGIYLVQGSSHIIVDPNPNLTTWHHAKIQVTPSTGKSSYWMDGMVLGLNYTTSNPVLGTSAASGYIIGIKPTCSGGSFYHLDNFQCYHL